MLVNLKVRTCLILVLLLFTGAMFVSNGVAWVGLDSSNQKLDQVNDAYSTQAAQLNRAYSLFLRGRLLLATSLMDMQQGKTEQAASQAKRAEGLMQEGAKALDAYRKAPRLAGSEAVSAKLENAYKQFDGLFKRLVDSGADVLQEPTEQPYGVRDCAFRDPTGNLIRINELR